MRTQVASCEQPHQNHRRIRREWKKHNFMDNNQWPKYNGTCQCVSKIHSLNFHETPAEDLKGIWKIKLQVEKLTR